MTHENALEKAIEEIERLRTEVERWRNTAENKNVEIERLYSDLSITQDALRRACTPPWPTYSVGNYEVDGILMQFHLRHAREAAEAAGGEKP